MRWRVLLVVLLSVASFGAFATEVEIHHFWSATCPDCLVMKAFLSELAQEHPGLVVIEHEVTFSPENWRRMVTLGEVYGLRRTTTPTVIVGDLALAGIGRAVELQIREEVERCLARGCPSPLERLPERLRPAVNPLQIALLLVVATALVWLVWGLW